MRRPQVGYIFTSNNEYWDEIDKPKTKFPTWAKNYILIREYTLGTKFYYSIETPCTEIQLFDLWYNYQRINDLADALIAAQNLALNNMDLKEYKLFIVCSFIGRY